MFKFFKNNLCSYERPILFSNSKLIGFSELISCGQGSAYSPTDTLPFLKVVDEIEIPEYKLYFKYIGNGNFIRTCKYFNSQRNKKIPLDVEIRVDEYSRLLNDFSPIYTKKDLGKLCFQFKESGEWRL